MERYEHYSFSDFLSDPDFRQWVKNHRPQEHPFWPKIPLVYTDKAEFFYQAADVIEALSSTEDAVSPRELDFEVEMILRSTAGGTPATRFYKLYWAAAILLATGLAAWLLKPESTPAFQAYQELKKTDSSGVLQRSNSSNIIDTFQLPDGSLAQLYPGASIKYRLSDPVQNGSPQNDAPLREVYMTGDVFFDVAKDTTRPFVVYTDGFITQVMGTSFLIRASGEEASVEVKSGKVVVRPLLGKPKEEIALNPNQRATFLPQANQLAKDLAPEPELLEEAVDQALFNFENTPIQEVFTVLEKAYGIPILFEADALGDCSLSVRMGDEPFYNKLAIITKTIEATFSIVNGEVVINGKGCS